jgi:hypothetical protein
MKTTKPDINEGDLCQIPLLDGSSLLGLVARIERKYGLMLLYVFDLRFHGQLPDFDLSEMKNKVQGIYRTWSETISDGRWPIMGKLEPWRRSEWPMPTFVLYREITDDWVARVYADDLSGRLLIERRATEEESRTCPPDRIYGSLEKHLNQAFGLLPVPPKKERKPPPPGSMAEQIHKLIKKKKSKRSDA